MIIAVHYDLILKWYSCYRYSSK